MSKVWERLTDWSKSPILMGIFSLAIRWHYAEQVVRNEAAVRRVLGHPGLHPIDHMNEEKIEAEVVPGVERIPGLVAELEKRKHETDLKQIIDEISLIARNNPGRSELSQAVPVLIALVEDRFCWARKEAVIALGHIGDSEAIPALVKILYEYNSEARYPAIIALKKMEPRNHKDLRAFRDAANYFRKNAKADEKDYGGIFHKNMREMGYKEQFG